MDAANAGITANGFVGYTSTDTYSGGDWVYIDQPTRTSPLAIRLS
jgi:hypothetical protein